MENTYCGVESLRLSRKVVAARYEVVEFLTALEQRLDCFVLWQQQATDYQPINTRFVSGTLIS